MLPLIGALAGQLVPCGLTPEPEVDVALFGDVLLGVNASGEAEVLLARNVVIASAFLLLLDKVRRMKHARHAALILHWR